MRPFVLVDLYSQMPYLPREMRSWPRERVLMWMRLFGEVWQIQFRAKPNTGAGITTYSAASYWRIDDVRDICPESDTFLFRSVIGMELAFQYSAPGELYRPGDLRRGWSSYA